MRLIVAGQFSCGHVAGPNLPTTMPAARLARRAASVSEAPAARPSASAAMTVSPAPVTSATSRASAGRSASPSGAEQPHAVFAARDEHAVAAGALAEPPGGRHRASSAVRMRMCVTASASWWFGVMTVAPRVVVDVRHLRIDEDRDAASSAPRRWPRDAAATSLTPFR